MTQEQKKELDKKIEALKPKILKAKDTYDLLLDEMSELLDQRYPERREEAIKGRLYDAYRRSGKSIDFIIDFIENADDEDDY